MRRNYIIIAVNHITCPISSFTLTILHWKVKNLKSLALNPMIAHHWLGFVMYEMQEVQLNSYIYIYIYLYIMVFLKENFKTACQFNQGVLNYKHNVWGVVWKIEKLWSFILCCILYWVSANKLVFLTSLVLPSLFSDSVD